MIAGIFGRPPTQGIGSEHLAIRSARLPANDHRVEFAVVERCTHELRHADAQLDGAPGRKRGADLADDVFQPGPERVVARTDCEPVEAAAMRILDDRFKTALRGGCQQIGRWCSLASPISTEVVAERPPSDVCLSRCQLTLKNQKRRPSRYRSPDDAFQFAKSELKLA